MPREVYSVSPLTELTLPAINRLVTEINAALANIANSEARLEGRDGHLPRLNSDLDMGGYRIRNLGAPRRKGDAVRHDPRDDTGD